ncbi:hypothetical protein Asera_01910 [Actinocatenispora sera]|uniref:Lipoprotein n=2 Tax=Actinocatenispora sera TaxID=390989 RepID=A0A810KS99_9ACTN|nr:hypothetical protein Asera_01910 [Actinocatenispora sera]
MAAALLLTGCSATGAYHFRGRSVVVNDLAAQLDHGQARSYTAHYRLADAGRAVLVQQGSPHRLSYTFFTGSDFSGRYVRLVTRTVRCTATSCTVADRAPTDRIRPPDAGALAAASGDRFVTTEQILGLVRTAAEQRASTIEVDRRTVGGQPVRCLRVTGIKAPFTACLTHSGAPALFRGTVDGRPIDLALTSYQAGVVGHPFGPRQDLPVVDHRASPAPN